MKNFNDDNVKELSFGGEQTPTPEVNEERPNPTPSNNGGGNSFYDRQQDKNTNTKWTKDWRGKTLGLSIAALILISGGIVGGMAIGGYFKNPGEANLVDQTDLRNALELAGEEVDRVYDEAITLRYDALVNEGYISQTAHDNKIEDIEDSAVDTIDNEKESLKDSYGDTWEDEWDKELKSKGFHTAEAGGEEEYKQSIIADSLLTEVKSQYTSMSSVTSTVREDEDVTLYKYASNEANAKGRYYVVENSFPITYKDETAVVEYSYTPEDLVTLYLWTYQPIVFSNSLLPFLPVEGANDTTANIEGDNIYMTNENVMSAKSFAYNASSSTEQAATNYGGIQKRYDIDFTSQGLGQEANIAVNLGMAEETTDVSPPLPGDPEVIINIINAGFANVTDGVGDKYSDWNSTDINDMDTSDLNEFSEGIAEALKSLGLLTKIEEGTTTYRTFATTGVYGDTVSFVSTNGLNNIGVSFEDEEVVVQQLDYYADVNGAIDLSFISSFDSWLENSFKYIVLIDHFTTLEDETTLSWFNEDGSFNLILDSEVDYTPVVEEEDFAIFGVDSEDEDAAAQAAAEMIKFEKLSLLENISIGAKTTIASNYNEGKSFVEEHWRDYDSSAWETTGDTIITFQEGSNLNKISDVFFTYLDKFGTETKNVVINERGDK